MPKQRASLWERPLRITILEILEKNKGRIVEKELLEKLRRIYGDISKREIYTELMRLEVNGIIYVDSTTPTNKVIELIKGRKVYLVTGGTE